MFRRGLVAETEGLLRQGLSRNPTALQALGYRQAAEYLAGRRDLPQTIELVKIRTHQFAKRQMTWFRRQMRLRWIHLQETPPTQVLEEIERALPSARERPSSPPTAQHESDEQTGHH